MNIRCHDIHIKFHKDWFKHSETNMGGFTDTWRSHKPTLGTRAKSDSLSASTAVKLK
jgi:hypothetical protein